jgi:hypothetical protein
MLMVLLAGCASEVPEELAGVDIQAAAVQTGSPDIDVTGLVRQHDYGGDSFLIVEGDDGIHYEAANLPSDYRQPGLRVRLQARRTAPVSPRRLGPMVEIVSIDRL